MTQSTNKPEEWAVRRAKWLTDQIPYGHPMDEKYEIISFAHYIAAHEQPPEPDWEAWRPALDALRGGSGFTSNPLDAGDKDWIRALIAASKVMPKVDVA